LAQEKVEFPITGKVISVNVILAPVGGTVSEIGISAGQVVEVGEAVALIEY
jgi:biotin carboxyl carrier protein